VQPEAYRYETVRQSVLDLIDSGGLRPGDKAPSLRRLASRMRVSLSTVLMAYGQLESEGVLEARPKSGYFVRPPASRLPLPSTKARPDEFPETLNRAELIRKLLENMSRRDLVPLGVARTDEALLPLAQLNRMLVQALRDEGEKTGYYGPVPGLDSLRLQIASHALEAGIETGMSGTLVTNGAMEALYVALRSVTRPGDTVAIASPTYYCFLQLLENLGLRVIEAPSRPGEGVRPEDLALVTERFRIAACVLTPNFNNPDGALMPDEAKAEIVALLARKGIPLIEDDVYGDLHFEPQRPRCCKSYDRQGLVLHCSSFSKVLSPGYRVGWLMPGRFIDKALEIKATTSVASATPTQMAVAEFLRQGLLHRHLKRLRPALKSMMDNMLGLIERHFPPGTRATRPRGGTVCWLELPGGGDGVEFMRLAMEHGIGAAPGALFSSQGCFRRFVRLSSGVHPGPALDNAMKTLGRIAWEMVDGEHAQRDSGLWENDPIAMSEGLLKDS